MQKKMTDSTSGLGDVFAIGTPVVDYFAHCTDKFIYDLELEKGSTNFITRANVDEICKNLGKNIISISPGDNARNTCEGIKFLGGKCTYGGSIGNDFEGKMFSNSLKSAGISSLLETPPGTTGKIVCLITPDAQRTFAANLGNGEDYSTFDLERAKRHKYFFLTSITVLSKNQIGTLSIGAMKRCADAGVQVAFSLESPAMISNNAKAIMKILDKNPISVVFGNEEEYEALGLDPLTDYIGTAKIAVLKKGEEGSVIITYPDANSGSGARIGIKAIKIPPVPVDVVDTTGAGDSFAAGFLYGISRCKTLQESGDLGAQLASRAISRMGASVF